MVPTTIHWKICGIYLEVIKQLNCTIIPFIAQFTPSKHLVLALVNCSISSSDIVAEVLTKSKEIETCWFSLSHLVIGVGSNS